jgi:N-methylhydantoinase A
VGSKVVGVDVGGTFIDVVSYDRDTGAVAIEKQPSTPDRLADEILTAIERLPATAASDVDRLLHASTVAINALVQRRGGTVGLITTKGFGDVLELARGNRPFIYDWVWVPPEPLVPRERRKEVTERQGPHGEEIVPLDRTQVADAVADLVDAHHVDAIAICFLHAYANPKHEREAAEAIAQARPGVLVTLSSDVVAEWHEYERTSTAVINAYVRPIFGGYVGDVQRRLNEAGMAHPIGVMQSSGGVMSVERAVELPVRTLSSGPAGGVVGAAALARHLGHRNVICTDVGGTTYDVAIIEDGRVHERTETAVGGLPVLVPTIDVVSIGAGGGSIASIDDRGALKVGPSSAGARPGPACFGFGGTEPTVTDCHLVLGRLDPERFLGSRMRLDTERAAAAIRSRIAEPLGMDVEPAADGILTIVENAMANAIHSMTVERGTDPRGFALYAYGGGGGLFAAATAAEIEVATIVVPPAPANFSAWGILASEHREDVSITRVRGLDDESMRSAIVELDQLRAEILGRLGSYGLDEHPIRSERRADLRFEGQEHTVTVELDDSWGPANASDLARRFVERHRRLYGHGDDDARIELVTVRCRAAVEGDPPRWPAWTIEEPAEPRTERRVWFREAGGAVTTPVYDRDTLAIDQRIAGPSLIEEWTSTVIVPPTWAAAADREGNLVLSRDR